MGSISDSVAKPKIPIIDLTAFLSPESPAEDRLKVAQDLVSACRHVGFVYIKNHGVPQNELEQAFAVSKKFYDLPTEQKMKAPHPPGWSVHRGYSWPGLEKVSSAISEIDDDEAIKQLREVQDYKVDP
jgi:isopenicillin N synthase-like dioxygenase